MEPGWKLNFHEDNAKIYEKIYCQIIW